jgi:hypothetical protein
MSVIITDFVFYSKFPPVMKKPSQGGLINRSSLRFEGLISQGRQASLHLVDDAVRLLFANLTWLEIRAILDGENIFL